MIKPFAAGCEDRSLIATGEFTLPGCPTGCQPGPYCQPFASRILRAQQFPASDEKASFMMNRTHLLEDDQIAQPGGPVRDQPGGTSWVDQVVRRQLFETAHPDVTISHPGIAQPWSGVVPLPGGGAETVTSHELGYLLDTLERIVRTRNTRVSET
jgi:hypothetical protein